MQANKEQPTILIITITGFDVLEDWARFIIDGVAIM
jgi:hypothetical protein